MNKTVFVLSLMMVACSEPEDDDHGGHHHHPDIEELRFQARAGGAAFSCTEVYSFGTNNADFAPASVRFTVSAPVIVTEDGEDVPFTLDGTGEVNFGCSGEVRTTLAGHAEGGHYHQLRFTLTALTVTSADTEVSLSPGLVVTVDDFNADRSDAVLTLETLFAESALPVTCTGACDSLNTRLPLLFSAGE